MKKETIASFEEDGILNIEKVINGYNAYIYRILRNGISNEADIEEILSDVFIIFWKNYKRLDRKTEIKPYLIGITKNLIKKKYKDYSGNIENIELYENNIEYNLNIEELAEKVKDTIQVIFVDEDGEQEEVKGNVYVDSNNHTIEKYEIEKNGTEHILEVDKNNLDESNLTIKDKINDEQSTITIEDK